MEKIFILKPKRTDSVADVKFKYMDIFFKEITLSYLAGLFDGEGYICFYHSKAGRRLIIMGISNTNHQVLKDIYEFLYINDIQSKIIARTDKRQGKNSFISKKLGFDLVVSRQEEVYKFISLMKDELRIKRGQAELAYKFLKSRIAKKDLPANSKRYNNWEKYIFNSVKEVRNFEIH